MDFIDKYKLKLLLDNKTLLLCYILLMILNYIIINNFIFDKNKLNLNQNTINYFYIAIVFCLIVNMLLINFAMKSKTLEISIFNREMLTKNIYILFTFLQCIITILIILMVLNCNEPNFTNKNKYIMTIEIVIINFVTIAFAWNYATTSCNVVDKLT